MGRELRRVPPNYNHPQVMSDTVFYGRELRDVAMRAESLEEAQTAWDAKLALWKTGKEPYYVGAIPETEARIAEAEAAGDEARVQRQRTYLAFCLENVDVNPTDKAGFTLEYGERPKEPEPGASVIYRTWAPEEATWYQVWQTVSEGSPVTPPFATPEELVDYLVAYGEEFRGENSSGPYSRKAAEQMVHGRGWFPSSLANSGGAFLTAKDGFPDPEEGLRK